MELTLKVVCKTLFSHDVTGETNDVARAMTVLQDSVGSLGEAEPQDARFTDAFLVVAPGITIRDRLRVLLWERGVGPTFASGTGACGAAVAAAAYGGAARDVEVVSPGGSQRVEWLEDGLYLTGWATLVFEGSWLN